MATVRQQQPIDVQLTDDLNAVIIPVTVITGELETTDATETEITNFNVPAADADDQVYFVDAIVSGYESSTGNVIMNRINIMSKHVGGTSYVGTETDVYLYSEFSTASVRVYSYDSTPGSIKVLVTGEAATAIKWTCEMTVKQMKIY